MHSVDCYRDFFDPEMLRRGRRQPSSKGVDSSPGRTASRGRVEASCGAATSVGHAVSQAERLDSPFLLTKCGFLVCMATISRRLAYARFRRSMSGTPRIHRLERPERKTQARVPARDGFPYPHTWQAGHSGGRVPSQSSEHLHLDEVPKKHGLRSSWAEVCTTRGR